MSDFGKCIVIGAAGGIGRCLVDRLAGSGWDLVLAGRNERALTDVASELGEHVSSVVSVDAQRFDDVEALFADHADATGVVNLAGSILLKPAHMTSEADFDETLNQNIRTAFAVARAAGKSFRGGASRSVVLMSSCAAQMGLSNHEAISAAKGAVEGLTRSAAATYAGAGLRFNAVAPGLTDTPLASKITQNEASLKVSQAMHPLGRIGQPDEVARVIQFLLDPANSWMTGQVIGIDGGLARVKTR